MIEETHILEHIPSLRSTPSLLNFPKNRTGDRPQELIRKHTKHILILLRNQRSILRILREPRSKSQALHHIAIEVREEDNY